MTPARTIIPFVILIGFAYIGANSDKPPVAANSYVKPVKMPPVKVRVPVTTVLLMKLTDFT